MLQALIGRPELVWQAERPADWRQRPADWPATRYEQKALAAGRSPVYLRYRRRAELPDPGPSKALEARSC
jgi:tRNA (guanine-N7-)-methyltransferase